MTSPKSHQSFIAVLCEAPFSALKRRLFDIAWPIVRYSKGASVFRNVKSKLSCTREREFSTEADANEFQILPIDIMMVNRDTFDLATAIPGWSKRQEQLKGPKQC